MPGSRPLAICEFAIWDFPQVGGIYCRSPAKGFCLSFPLVFILMAEEFIPIVQKAYDFAVNLYLYVNHFPRAHKPLIGRELISILACLTILSKKN